LQESDTPTFGGRPGKVVPSANRCGHLSAPTVARRGFFLPGDLSERRVRAPALEVHANQGFLLPLMGRDGMRLMPRTSWVEWTERLAPRGTARPLSSLPRLLLPLSLFVLFVAAWEGLVRWQGYPPYILPAPEAVWHKFLLALADGTLWRHTRVTLVEILGGLAIGLSLAMVLGYVLAKSPVLERLVGPYVVAAQAIPVIAIAPLVILWAGSGLTAKMLVAALTLFFPTLVNTMVGIRSVERDLLDLMRALNASRWQVFYKLELPASLPILFGGLKIGVALSVIGAVVGEFVAADQGLGFLINLTSRGTLDTALLFVALGVLVVIAVTMYTTVGWLERHLLRWRG